MKQVSMKYHLLLSPINIGSIEVKNRFVVPPMSTNYANLDGSVSQRLTDYWVARAKGGWGLLIVEYTAIDPYGKASLLEPGIWSDSLIPGWKELTNEVHKYGAKMAVQLHHAGREAVRVVIGTQPVAPSPVQSPANNEVPRELSTEEVYALIEKFGDAARRARDAGFDAVEIHGAHGYLVAQFMSANSNKRMDEFGGTFMDRMHFPIEIVRDIKRKTGNSYPVTFRLSASERISGGITISESRAAASVLESVGVNAIHVSMGTPSTQWVVAPFSVPPGYIVPDAEEIKKSVDIPVIAVGRIHSPELAENILKTGKADLVSMGRQSLTDPELPNKVTIGTIEDIAPCIGCMQGCIGYLIDPNKGKTSCLVNPFCGNERSLKIEEAANHKKVMVVGGGPGGLEAAWILAKRGHSVTLYEKRDVLGGQFRVAAMVPFKQDIVKALKYYIRMGHKHGVTYNLGIDVSEDLVIKEKPDAVVLATGSLPFVPNIKGIDKPCVLLATDLLEGKKSVGNNVTIVGGGLVGSETADFLGDYGCQITVIEMLSDIALDEQASVRYFLLKRLRNRGVHIIVNAKVKEIFDDGLTYEKDGKVERIGEFDSIVLAMGTMAYNPLECKIKDKVKEVYVIGDALKARKAIDAIEDATRVALTI